MTRYRINLEVYRRVNGEATGEHVTYEFNNDYPSENIKVDMTLLNKVVDNYAKDYVKNTYGEFVTYKVTKATYSYFKEDKYSDEKEVILNHPHTDFKK